MVGASARSSPAAHLTSGVKRPSRVDFAAHADKQASTRGINPGQVAELVLAEHPRRRRNVGFADWVVRGQGIGAAYNWPAEGDQTTALVITVWAE